MARVVSSVLVVISFIMLAHRGRIESRNNHELRVWCGGSASISITYRSSAWSLYHPSASYHISNHDDTLNLQAGSRSTTYRAYHTRHSTNTRVASSNCSPTAGRAEHCYEILSSIWVAGMCSMGGKHIRESSKDLHPVYKTQHQG